MDALVTAGPVQSQPVLHALQGVSWLSTLGPEALAHVASRAQPVQFAVGQTLLAELEAGDDLFVFVTGRARVDVIAAGGRRKEIATLGPGDACGELSVLTHDLRSATVTALEPVSALRLERADFDDLLACHPSIAVHFARLLSKRLLDSDTTLDALVGADGWKDDPTGGNLPSLDRLEQLAPAGRAPIRATLRRAWRELVVSHRKELPFLALASFLCALLGVRLAIGAASWAGVDLFASLRTAYTTGIALVFASTSAALMRFRRNMLRWVAIVFGVGFALILNELSVFLAFDTFYLDMTTRDPTMAFSVEALYRRSESSVAVALMLALLVLLTYLRHFLNRAAFVLLSKVRNPKAAGG